MQKGGVNPQFLKSRIRAERSGSSWYAGVIPQTCNFPRRTSSWPAGQEPGGASTTAIEYTLRPILFLVPPGAQATIDAKRKEAEGLRARFKNCQDGLAAARATGAVVRDQVIRSSGDLNPELQKVLDAVPVGQLTAPEVTRHGVEMWAICGKQDSKADAPIKKQTREALATERFEQQSKTYLQRLRREALIEHKQAERTERTERK